MNREIETPETSAPRLSTRRFYALALLLVVAYVASARFRSIAESPAFDIHSDDLLIISRFMIPPRAVAPSANAALEDLGNPSRTHGPIENWEYVHGLDHPALQRWIFHYLLTWTGRMPDKLPAEDWDYTKDHKWNVQRGHVAPPEARYFVRMVNACFMIAAAVLIYLAVARAVTPAAGLVSSLFFTLHPNAVPVLWSLGQDPLLWMMISAALLLWVCLGATTTGAVLVGLAAGLATSSKLNGAYILVAFLVWLLAKRKWRLALLSGAIAFALFLLLNPVLFSRGILGLPHVLRDFLAWRTWRAGLYTQAFPSFLHASGLRKILILLGKPPWLWTILAIALLDAPRLRRLQPLPLWAAFLALAHLFTVPAPEPRYIFPIHVGLVVGIVASYWPTSPRILLDNFKALFRSRAPQATQPPSPLQRSVTFWAVLNILTFFASGIAFLLSLALFAAPPALWALQPFLVCCAIAFLVHVLIVFPATARLLVRYARTIPAPLTAEAISCLAAATTFFAAACLLLYFA